MIERSLVEMVEEYGEAVSLADDNANHGNSKYQDEYEIIANALRNEIRQRIAELERDAARYRWLADECAVPLQIDMPTGRKWWVYWPDSDESQVGVFESANVAIDAAMARGD
jgi:hypothetical protein